MRGEGQTRRSGVVLACLGQRRAELRQSNEVEVAVGLSLGTKTRGDHASAASSESE
jgi:hypothetical protein